MNKMITILLSGAAFMSLGGVSANAATLVTGGVGEDSADYVQQVQNNYNLKMTFTGNGGMYLSDVDVKIHDTKGNQVAEGLAEGPMMLGELESGRYVVTAEKNGIVKKVNVSLKESLKSYVINFPVADEDAKYFEALSSRE